MNKIYYWEIFHETVATAFNSRTRNDGQKNEGMEVLLKGAFSAHFRTGFYDVHMFVNLELFLMIERIQQAVLTLIITVIKNFKQPIFIFKLFA